MRIFLSVLVSALVASATRQPNVVLVITDDQGFGDLGYTGNKVVQTPHIDNLIEESVWLEDYHVAPTCSPTRCSLLTGRFTDRTGVWHTIQGRSMLRTNEITLADYLQKAGYQTGIFGKWHLGDNYPYRPEDRGFTHTFYHGAGGVGQTPDAWNNDYFDDRYWKNGKLVQTEGYCTDVYFNEARKFIKKNAEAGVPFFTYITTNAPHSPLSVSEEYMKRYRDQEGVSEDLAAFYGMITNIDDNVGQLRDLLVDLEVANDTIFIFTTDNGTAHGAQFYNAGMRGQKGTEYEGGHRVPFALHWPYYGLDTHKPIKELTHMVDIVPTLLDFCEYEQDGSEQFDGITLEALVGDKSTSDAPDTDWENRILVSDSQRVKDPVKWKQTSVMSGKWRLVNGDELYQVKLDPGQETNLIEDYPEIATRLTKWYDAWWAEIEPTFAQTTEIYIGDPKCPIVDLNAHDWIQEKYPPWNQSMIRGALAYTKSYGDMVDGERAFLGHWAVKAITAGEYEFTLRRWHRDSELKLTEGTSAMPVVPGVRKGKINYSATEGDAIPITGATLRIDGKQLGTKPVTGEESSVSFTATLTEGSHELSPYFTVEGDKWGKGAIGVYYVEVKRVD